MTQGYDIVYLTAEGLQQIEDELEYLTTVRREEISLKLEAAIRQGDLKENADYHDAKDEQGFVEGRIRDLEDLLRRAQLIEDSGPSDVVRVGGNGRISNESPIGRALLGARTGDIVSAETPAGEIRFEIQSIS
jgi:transcription elongation factor GreA